MISIGTNVTALVDIHADGALIAAENTAGVVVYVDAEGNPTVQFGDHASVLFDHEFAVRRRAELDVNDNQEAVMDRRNGNETNSCYCCGRKAGDWWVGIDLSAPAATRAIGATEAVALDAAEADAVSFFPVGTTCRKRLPSGFALTRAKLFG